METMRRIFRASLIAVAALCPQAAGAEMPDGKAKPLVEGMCASCHALQLIHNSSGYTRELEGAGRHHDRPLPRPQQQNEITEYLAANFPSNNRRVPKVVPGDFQVTFKEWVMPQLGQRTRDPMQAADGSIWYAGQYGNLIGRLEPKTGRVNKMPDPAAKDTHTIAFDKKGFAYFTFQHANMLVQRVRHAARHAGAFRHRDRNITSWPIQVRKHLRGHPA